MVFFYWYFNCIFDSPFLDNPTRPTVFPLMPCGSGTKDTATLGCLATGFTPSSVTYTWKRNGAALEGYIEYPSVLKGNVYTGVSQIQVTKQEWDTSQTFQCVVKNDAGEGNASFQKGVKTYRKSYINSF